MTLSFPEHPFFQAAAVAGRVSVSRLRRSARIFAILFWVLFFWYLVGGPDATLAFALFSLAAFLALSLAVRFLSFYDGRGLSSLPQDPAELGRVNLASDWPMVVDFASAGVLARLSNPDDPESLIRAILGSVYGVFFFGRGGFDREAFLKALGQAYLKTPHPVVRFADVIGKAAEIAIKHAHRFITPADFLAAVAELDLRFSQLLAANGFSPSDFDTLAHWLAITADHERPKPWVEQILSSPGIGKAWAYGYTPWLDRVSRPLDAGKGEELHVVAHGGKISELEEALSKSSAANALVIGEPGVGKMTVVKGLAARVRSGKSTRELNYRRVVRLLMQEVLADQSLGVHAVLERVFGEAERAGNVVLVIEDIELYLEPGVPTRLTESLLPFLRSPRMRVIGLTTPQGYAKSAAGESAVSSLFSGIRIEEPDAEMVMEILCDAALAAERRARRRITYPTLKRMYEYAGRYISDAPFPEKAIVLLEEAFAYAEEHRERIVTPEIVELVLERKYGTKLGAVEERERHTLVDLESLLHSRVVDQEEALQSLADAIRRRRAGVSAGGKPAGSFLFLGPTGVGKTETAKALAEAYYGSEEKMIRLDMSEYQNAKDIDRLIGDQATRGVGVLAEKIRSQPFSLLLLDEIEKAHPNVLNLFLQILDEGRASDAYGSPIDFRNAIIIGTSNAGSEFIREKIGAGMPYAELKRGLMDQVLRDRVFQPEFVNRFDAVVVYSPLAPEHVREVAKLLLGRLAKRLEAEGYRLTWSEEAVNWLAEAGYSPAFGGRELRRLIQDKVESTIAKDILAGKYQKGGTITVSPPAPTPVPSAIPG